MSEYEPEVYQTVLFSPQSAQRQQKFRVLGTLGLTALSFFISCGGPIGAEPLVSAGGPLVGLVAVVAYVVLCALPFAYVVAELTSTFPENGGYTVWTMAAFGPFWGFQVGYWSWASYMINNAIYPSLIYSTITGVYGIDTRDTSQYFVKVVIAGLLCVPSLLSVRFVAGSALVLLVLISSILLLFSVWGFADGSHAWSRLLEVRSSGTQGDEIEWSILINTLIWNFDGLYDTSVIAGEVSNPAKTYPRMLILNIAITATTYLVPLASAVTATSSSLPWTEFNENSLPMIAKNIGGSALQGIVLVSLILGLVGLFTTSIMFQSFQVLGMAHLRLLPAAFRTRHRTFQTPQYATLVSMLTTVLLLLFDFRSVVSMTNAFSAAIQMMISLAMLRLRRELPNIPRPVKVPGSLGLISTIFVPKAFVFLYILYTTLSELQSALTLGALILPGVIYGLYQYARVQEILQRRLQQMTTSCSRPTVIEA